MTGMRLEFAQFGDFDSFDIIRSDSSMAGVAEIDLPSPIATGLPTMYYVDTTVVFGELYYYKARVWRDGVSELSSEIKVLASKYRALILSDHPVAYYPLDELSGSVAADAMGNPVNGSIYNCTLGQTALSVALGTCYYFNGSNSRIELGAPAKFLISGSASMEVWLKSPDATFGNTFQIGYNNGLRMQISGYANLIFAEALKLQSTAISSNTLYHIVFTCTNTKLCIYINGVLVSSIIGGGWTGINSASGSALGYAGGSYGEYFKGFMCHVALYDYELTNDQVIAHYNAGVATE